MDDIPMVDDSPEALLPHQNFSVDVVLGSDESKATGSSISPNEGPLFKSDYFEENEIVIVENFKKLYPHVDFKKQQIPRCWNTTDRYHSLNISTDLLKVRYKGKGQTHKDAAAVRANCPIPKTCGVYYFEVLIASKGLNGYMGIGLSERNVNLNRLPGWDQISYGYHGDDGNFFASSGKGIEYGPTFTTGDVVGCGINFVTREIFFTKNGINIGVAQRNIPIINDLFPTVGMQTMDEMVDTNFGQKPFIYNIQADIEAAERLTINSIRNMELPQERAIWMNRAISTWLAHEGYSQALESFNKATGLTETEAKESLENRKNLSKLIISGKVSEAIKIVEEFYPHLMDENKQLSLLLKTQQFIEMLRNINNQDTSSMNGSSHSTSHTSNSEPLALDLSSLSSRSAPSTSRGNGSKRQNLKRRSSQEDEHRQSPRRALHETVPTDFRNGNSSHSEEPMDVGPECTNGNSVSTTNGCSAGLSSTTIITEPIDGEANGDIVDLTVDGLLPPNTGLTNGYSKTELLPFEKYQPLIEFGQDTFSLFKQVRDCPSQLVTRMNDAFSLICYTDLNQSDKTYLFEQSQRELVANALNSAVLQHLGKENVSPLDKYIVKAHHLREKVLNTTGGAVYADVNRMVFGDSPK
uniref:Ran-binding protein 9 n=1 Tax=Acrobeloides nanus TaxID=290746 RepID=A0A914DK08_9BILA